MHSIRQVWFLALMLLGRAAEAAPVPPVPDSLQAPLRAATSPAARQAVLLRIAGADNAGADLARVNYYAGAAARLARQRGDSVGVGQALDQRGFCYLQQADQHQARPLLLQAEVLLRPAPPAARAANDFHLGWLYGDTNQPAKALRYLRRAYAGFGRVGNPAQQAEVLNTVCVAHLYLGQLDSAALVLVRAARLQHGLCLAAAEASTLGNLATVLHQQGQLSEADRYARQALTTLQRLGDEASQPGVYQTLGNVAWARHRPAEALPYYRACVRLLQQQGLEGNLTSCYGSMAGALSDLGQADSAIYYQKRAVALTQKLGQQSQTSIEMAALAQVYLAQNQLSEASRWARASLALQGPQLLQTSRPLTILMRVAERNGNFKEALRLSQQIQAVEAARKTRETERQTAELRIGYETEKAEQQVSLLTQQTRLQTQQQELSRLRSQRQLAAGVVVVLLLLVGAGIATAGYRRRQLRREQALRQQIAADLHDDVGSLLTQISLQSELLSQGVYGPEQQEKYLAHMAEASRSAVRQMSDVVWGLNSSDDDHANLATLLERLREHAHDVLPAAGLEIDFATEPGLESASLPLASRQALYLIYKEALHNAVKHAKGATEVCIRLARAGQDLRLEVRDNGAGPTGSVKGLGGNGLRNMQARARAAGGGLAYDWQGPGFGITALLPL